MRMIGDQASAAQMIIYLAFCPALVAIGSARSARGLLSSLRHQIPHCHKDSTGRSHHDKRMDDSPRCSRQCDPRKDTADGQPLGFIGQYALTYAGQRVSGTQVSIVMYLGVRHVHEGELRVDNQVVSGTFLQWLIYGDHPSWIAFVGMAIFVICGIHAAVSSFWMKRTDYRFMVPIRTSRSKLKKQT